MIYDVIIIGSGISGLQCALNLDKNLKTAILCNLSPTECNTSYAQGGVAVSTDEKDIASHMADTLKTGAGLCKQEAVETLCNQSIPTIRELEAKGFSFDKNQKGKIHYTKEGAHSKPRVIHAGGDRTGRELENFLLAQNRATIHQDLKVSDIEIHDNGFINIECFDGKDYVRFGCSTLVFAFGGMGSLYKFHTNSKTANGQLMGLCIQKGFAVENLEFTQFHPTVYVDSSWARKMLLSEALRGEGATIVDETGYGFLKEYDARESLASRDVISRAIFDYTKKSGKKSYLSIANFTKDYFEKRFPFIYENLSALGYTIPTDKIPIFPAFHYSIGGLVCNLDGQITSHADLYAVGECSSTGVHGANRLASNSLLEGLVFGKRAALHINANFSHKEEKKAAFAKKVWRKGEDEDIKDKIRDIMWSYAGIIRDTKALSHAHDALQRLSENDTGIDTKYRIKTAKKIIEGALQRKNSIGVHFIK